MRPRRHAVLIAAQLFLVGAAHSASARPSAKPCRQQCAALMAQECAGLHGGALRRCRKGVVKRCRRDGLAACAPMSTTTTLPVMPFSCPTTPGAGCNGGLETRFASEAWTLVEPPPNAMPPLTHQWMTAAPSCATHTQVAYVVDAATGALLSPRTFDHPGGTTSVTAHVTLDAAQAEPWIVTVEADDGGPPGYPGGKTATVYPVLCFY